MDAASDSNAGDEAENASEEQAEIEGGSGSESEAEGLFEVDRVVAKRTRRGAVQYRVRWEGSAAPRCAPPSPCHCPGRDFSALGICESVAFNGNCITWMCTMI